MSDLPIGRGATGQAVHDLQRRLTALGLGTGGDQPGRYGAATEAAVAEFQRRAGLDVDGRCGQLTWQALVEAGYRLNIARMFAAMLLLSLAGIVIFFALSLLSHLLLRRWHESAIVREV